MALDFGTLPQRFAALDGLAAGNPRGRALEALIGEMFSALPGVKVANTNAVSGSQDAEFDILLTNQGLETGLPAFSRDVLVECKSSAEPLGSRDVTHFLHQAELRHSKWSVLVSLAGITGDGDDLRAAHQVVSHFATRDIWLMLLVRKELEAIKSAQHLAAVVERKRTDEYLKLRVGTLAPAVIDELAPRPHGVKVETGPEAFRRAVTRMQDQALDGVLDRAVADRAGDPDGRATETALIDRARETLKALEQNAEDRRSAPDPDPFMRDVYSLVIDVGAAFVNVLDEDLADDLTRQSLRFDVRVTAPQRLRAHVGTELWDLLSTYRLEQVAAHDGYIRRDNVLAMLSMVVEEIMAIDDIDPADVSGPEVYDP